MFDNIFVLIGTMLALFGVFFQAFKYYFRPRLQETRGKLIIRALLYSFLSTIIVLIIAVSASHIRNKIANRIIPFKEETISVLILPFDPLEECISKKEDMAKAVYKNLKKQIIDVSLKDFEVQFISNGLPEGLSCPTNHVEARTIGAKYKADVIVWGVHFERAFPDTSLVSIYYTITDPNTYLEKQIGTTGSQKATADLIYEGKLLNDVNHVISFLIAQYNYQNFNLPQAAHHFEKSMDFVVNKNDQALVDIFFNLGDIYRFQSEYTKAINYYEKALSIDPNFMRAVVNIGSAYKKTGEFQKANEFYDRAIRLNPISAIDFNTRGVAYFHLAQYQKALEDLNRAIDLNPKFAMAYSNRASAYINLGQYQEALDDCNKAIDVNPKFAMAYQNRANVYYFLGQYQVALDDYNKAIDLNPKYYMAYNNRAVAYINLGQWQKALDDCNRAIELDTNHPFSYYNKACCLNKLSRNDESVESLQIAFEKGILNFTTIEFIKNDPDLSNLHDDPRYKKLIEKYSKK